MTAKGIPSHFGEKRKKNASFKGKTTTSTTNAGEKAYRECGKPGHQKKNCFVFKNKQKKAKGDQASISKDPPDKGNHVILIRNSSLKFSLMNTNFDVMQDDSLSSWIDSGTSRHVCNSTKWLKTYLRG